jgi:hypothetical protein
MRLMPALAAAAALSSAAAPARTTDAIPPTAPSTTMPVIGTVPEKCVTNDRLRVKTTDRGSQRKLGEMPPADQIKTVYRSKDGCPDPLVVRYGVGAPNAARPGD